MMAANIPQELLDLARMLIEHESRHAPYKDREYDPLYLPLDDYNPRQRHRDQR